MQACAMCGKRAPDGAVECGGCGHPFGGAPVKGPGLEKVRTGITLVYCGLVLILLTFLATVPLPEAMRGSSGVALLLTGLILAASLMSLAGKVLCLSVPSGSRLAPLIYASIGLEIVSTLVQVGARLSLVPANVAGAGSLGGLVAAALFIVFLWKLAAYIRRPDLVRTAAGVLVPGSVLFLLAVGLFVTAVLGAGVPEVVAVLVIFFLVFSLWTVVRYSTLLTGLKSAL